MLQITDYLSIDESEIHEEFVRASGPGGQNVNKVESAVQLRFDVRNSPSLPEAVRERLLKLAGNKLTEEGVLVMIARSARSQVENRQLAYERLVELIRRATIPPRTRHATKPTRASKAARLETKKRRSVTKKLRQSRSWND